MARPADGYRLKDGTRVPGASTIAGVMKDAAPLMWWAWREGREGRDYKDTAQRAADAGTLVHEAAEAWKQSQPYEWRGPADVVAKAKVGYQAFLAWTAQTRLKIEQTELSLVSERHRYGGTFDAILIGDKRVMADYKTAASVYPEHLLQVVAYGKLWEEHHPDQPIDGGYYILRFSREFGDFSVAWFSELEAAWSAFVHCRALYDLQATLKRRCR